MVIHLPGLFEEAEKNEKKGRPSVTLPLPPVTICDLAPPPQARSLCASSAEQTAEPSLSSRSWAAQNF